VAGYLRMVARAGDAAGFPSLSTATCNACINTIVRNHAMILADDATPKPDGIFGKDKAEPNLSNGYVILQAQEPLPPYELDPHFLYDPEIYVRCNRTADGAGAFQPSVAKSTSHGPYAGIGHSAPRPTSPRTSN
jgi:hypothetical protein